MRNHPSKNTIIFDPTNGYVESIIINDKQVARPNEYFKSLTLEELFYLKGESSEGFSKFIEEIIAERMADIRDEKINSILDGR